MALQSFNYLTPSDAQSMGLTPTNSNYLDLYNFSKYDMPELKVPAIKKFDETVGGFLKLFSNTEQMESDKLIWTELERKAVTYEDAVITAGTDIVLTRADDAPLRYRKHEKIRAHATNGVGVFIVLEVVDSQTVNLGTYDSASIAMVGGDYTDALENVVTYSLGIEVGKGSEGADFTAGLQLPYTTVDNRPAISREVYTELGSTPPVKGWVEINGNYYWYMAEIDATREKFLDDIEKKHMEGEEPASGSDAVDSLGLQGTKGAFAQVRDRGAIWDGMIETTADLEALIKHLNNAQGATDNLFLCNQSQEFKFDELGRHFNSSYGGSAALDNYIGEFMNAEPNKILDLSFYGFQYGGYQFRKQGWKYLKEYSFRGNDNIDTADQMHAFMVPIGQTPVAMGEQNLNRNPSTVMKNYMTKFFLRDYDTWTEGGAWVTPRTNGDDKFKIHWLEESLLALFNAEKFLIVEGTA